MGFLPSKKKGVPVSMFPSSNSMTDPLMDLAMINGLFSHDQWIINGLSMDYQRIVNNYQWLLLMD